MLCYIILSGFGARQVYRSKARCRSCASPCGRPSRPAKPPSNCTSLDIWLQTLAVLYNVVSEMLHNPSLPVITRTTPQPCTSSQLAHTSAANTSSTLQIYPKPYHHTKQATLTRRRLRYVSEPSLTPTKPSLWSARTYPISSSRLASPTALQRRYA
jgi:hypothetical protein